MVGIIRIDCDFDISNLFGLEVAHNDGDGSLDEWIFLASRSNETFFRLADTFDERFFFK